MEYILVVEDSRIVRSMLVAALRTNSDTTVLEASTFAQAKEQVRSVEGPIFVALLDLVLPDATHGEVVGWITDHEIPTVVFTSEINEDIRRALIRAGVIDYIVKRDRLAIDQVVRVVDNLRRNKNFTVLAVDDSTTMRHFFAHTLRNYCFDVFIAENGIEALELVDAHPEIRLVITDYTMPEMDGFELVRTLRKRYDPGRLAIIGTAGRGNAMLATRFLKEGADDFIAKPFWNEEFYARISQNIEILDRIDRLHTLNEMKNRFIGMAAHDIRSPLGGILNAIELFTTGYLGELSEEQREFLSSMQDNAGRVFGLINDLLDVSAIESGSVVLQYEVFDITELVREQATVLKPSADRKGVVIEIAAPEKPAPVIADRRGVEQIVNNIVSNAIKYTRRNSVVRIGTEQRRSTVALRIEDHGHGIPESEQTRLFTPFAPLSTRPTAGEPSHGLGLAIVKRLVDAHGGTVEVERSDEDGTVFLVELPIDHPETV